MSRLAVGMSWHGNRDKIRNLLRKEYKEVKVRDRDGRLVRNRNGQIRIRSKPVYKSGIYIISNSYDQPHYKVGMGDRSTID